MNRDLIIDEVKPTVRLRVDLERLLRPRSIALIGASAAPGSLGQSLLTNLEAGGYQGQLYLVNPKRPSILGRQCLGAIEELPASIDCAVLAIPGAAVLAAVRACAERGVRSAIIFSAGFAEAGKDGQAAQRELARIAQEHKMVIEGPNCLGMVNYVDGIPLTFVVTPPQKRAVHARCSNHLAKRSTRCGDCGEYAAPWHSSYLLNLYR